VLLDLSGVLYVGDAPLPGALAAVRRLQASGLALRYLTNVSRTPAARLRERLAAMGFDVPARDLHTAPLAARRYVERRGLRPFLLVHRDIRCEFEGLATEPPDAVVLGDAGDGFTYAALNRAFRLLADGAPLIATGANRCFQDRDGLSLDIGPFVAALEYAARVEAVVLGKPSAAFFLSALDGLGCAPHEAVMVGDDAEADVAGACAAGLAGILVRTGKYRQGDERRVAGPAAQVCADIGAAVELILEGRL
jgi:HAD superfamily hydrolase (TIGR01458 family)